MQNETRRLDHLAPSSTNRRRSIRERGVGHHHDRIRSLKGADRVDVLRGDILLPLIRRRANGPLISRLTCRRLCERGDRDRHQ